MKYSVSFGNPFEVYLSQDLLDENELEIGDPAYLEFDTDSDRSAISAKVDCIENFETEREIQSLFYLASNNYSEIIDHLDYEFPEYNEVDTQIPFSNSQSIDINNADQLNEFLDCIEAIQEIIHGHDIVIGIGLLDRVDPVDYSKEESVDTPLVSTNIPSINEKLDGDCPGLIEIDSPSSSMISQSEVYFCTNRWKLSEKQIERVKNQIADIEYFITYYNYQLPFYHTSNHGPLPIGFPDDSTLLRVSKDDIVLGNVDFLHFETENQSKSFNFEQIGEISLDYFNDAEIFLREDESEIRIQFNPVQKLILYIESDELNVDVMHDIDAVGIDVNKKLDEFIEYLENEIGKSIEKEDWTYRVPESTDIDKWVFDTNSIYSQVKGEDSTSIFQFVAQVEALHKKDVKIPWISLAEINKHKRGGVPPSVSEQGIENLKMLQKFSEVGLINLEVEDIPKEIALDELNYGELADMRILSGIRENEVLQTHDKRLKELSNIYGVAAGDITNLGGESQDRSSERLWDSIKEQLESGPVLESEVVQNVVSSESLESETQPSREDVESIVQEYDKRADVILAPNTEDEAMVTLAEEVDVVATFSLLKELGRRSSQNRIPMEDLESIRQAIGGLGKNKRPYLNFHIPDEYVYNSDDLDYKSPLYKIASARNINHTSETVTPDRLQPRPRLKETAVDVAKNVGCTLLCGERDEDLETMSTLLDVNIELVKLG